MKNLMLFIAIAMTSSLFAEGVDKDLPQEKKKERLPYYHDETPLCVEHSVYSDIFIHKWLDAPKHAEFEIPSQAFRKGANKITLTNASRGEMNVVYLVIRGF